MADATQIMYLLALVVLTTPAVLFAVLGLSSLVERKLSEQATSRACQAAIFTGQVAAVGVLAVMIAVGDRHVVIDLGKWVSVHHPGDPKDDYRFQVKFVFDRLSVPMVILSFLLCGTIGAFATRYRHREPGYNRFFVLYAVFLLGMVTASSAGTIETLFTGWELIGLSSALLVAFFQEALKNAICSRLPRGPGLWVRLAPEGARTWVYRFGLERGYLGAILNTFVVAPVVRLFRWCDRVERRWTDFLSGRASRESDLVRPHPHPARIDELP